MSRYTSTNPETSATRVAVADALSRAFKNPTATQSHGGVTAFLDAECGGSTGDILRIVRDLSRREIAFVIAACGPHTFGSNPGEPSHGPGQINHRWREAVDFVMQFTAGIEESSERNSNLARRLVERHFGARSRYSEIAELTGACRADVARCGRAVSQVLAAEEYGIWLRLTAQLRDVGALDPSVRSNAAVGQA